MKVKEVLQDEFEKMEKSYGNTITLRGKVKKEKIKELKFIPNLVVIY